MIGYLRKTEPVASWSKIIQSGWALEQLFVFFCQILLKKWKFIFLW